MFTTEAPRLALLIAAAGPGETAMHNDLAAMYAALRTIGFAPEDILCLEGGLRREMALAFLRAVRARLADIGTAAARPGPRLEIFFYYTGHGAFWPWSATDPRRARPALQIEPDTHSDRRRWLFWEEVWAALLLPPDVRLKTLPDC
jgi:hypothetical protein